MNNDIQDKIASGEIISMKSLLAFDEDIFCKRCGNTFTLIEGNWEGSHPKYPAVKAVGLKCPFCERVNVSYYKTQSLTTLENRLGRVSGKAREQAFRKYYREFMKVQQRYAENFRPVTQAQN